MRLELRLELTDRASSAEDVGHALSAPAAAKYLTLDVHSGSSADVGHLDLLLPRRAKLAGLL